LAAAALVGPTSSYRELVQRTDEAARLADDLDQIQQLANELADDLGLSQAGSVWEQMSLIEVVRAGAALGAVCWNLRRPAFTVPTAPTVLTRAEAQRQELHTEATQLNDLLVPAM